MTSRIITLSVEDVARCEQTARRIETENKRKRRRDTQGFREKRPGHSLDQRTLGYAAECAFARYLGIPWSAGDVWKAAPDVGDAWDVRSTWRMGLRLIITRRDPVQRRYVLVSPYKFIPRTQPETWAALKNEDGTVTLQIVGWIAGAEAITHAEWIEEHRAGGEAWFVPVMALHHAFDVPIPPSPSSPRTPPPGDARDALHTRHAPPDPRASLLASATDAERRGDWRAILSPKDSPQEEP